MLTDAQISAICTADAVLISDSLWEDKGVF